MTFYETCFLHLVNEEMDFNRWFLLAEIHSDTMEGRLEDRKDRGKKAEL